MALPQEVRTSQKKKLASISMELCGLHLQKPLGEILVIGCGDGTEAISFSQDAQIIRGIDPTLDNRDEWTKKTIPDNVKLQSGFAEELPFDDNSFDFIHFFHVIEHVNDPNLAISEAHRVLRKDGWMFIGCPNSWRLVGYIGGDATKREILRWNLKDWWMRGTLRWSNKKGAHAGFSRKALRRMLTEYFDSIEDRTVAYAEKQTSGILFKTLTLFGWWRFTLPSIYFCVQK